MVIDDEPSMLILLREWLEAHDLDVDTFENSPQALDNFRANASQFDLVISDQSMPEINGLEIARFVQSIRPDIPVILTSGYRDLLDENSPEHKQINFVEKPFDPGQLIKLIKQLIQASNS